jgi:hypothetical protein
MRILNENDFSKLVFDVAKDNPDVVDVNVSGFNVDLIFDSRDGKTRWNAFLCFNEKSARYEYFCPLQEAVLPSAFGDEVQERMRFMMTD